MWEMTQHSNEIAAHRSKGSTAFAGVLDEKASASQVLGSYPEHTGPLYTPHIQETLSMLLKMGNYFHCQVREQAYIALPLLYTATSQAFPAQPSGLTRPWPLTPDLLSHIQCLLTSCLLHFCMPAADRLL